MTTNVIQISTDGSITRNPGGRGGWAFLVQMADGREELQSGYMDGTTNNRMELQAIIEGLRYLHINKLTANHVLIRTDSEWAMRGCTGRNARRANVDQFDQFDALAAQFAKIRWQWVRGHNGDPANERVDAAARAAAFGAGEQVVDKLTIDR